MPRSTRSWSCDRDCTYSGYTLRYVQDLFSSRGINYMIDTEASPRDRDFTMTDDNRVAFVEVRDGTHYICVSPLR